jgi:hypothetical protein
MSSPWRLPCRAASKAKSFGEGRLTPGVEAARECRRRGGVGRGRPSAVERASCPDVGGYGDGHLPGSDNRAPYPTHAKSGCGASVALPDVVVQRSAWLRLGEATSGSLPPRSPPPGRASRPPVRVRAMPRASAALHPLRPRSALLRPRLLARSAPGRTARDRATLPAQPRRASRARRTITAVAPPPVCATRA